MSATKSFDLSVFDFVRVVPTEQLVLLHSEEVQGSWTDGTFSARCWSSSLLVLTLAFHVH